MFKRYLVPNFIWTFKQQHHITLITLLMFIMGNQNVYPQQQIALDTYAIFEQSCLICHGPDGAYKETLLMEHHALIEKGTVVPGNPDASELYKRLLGNTENGAQMPLGQPQLPVQSINTIRNWILAGAPDWAVTPTTDGDFISPGEVLDTIETHLMSLSSFDRAYARYFTLTHLYNAGETPSILQEYRKGLSKLINSLSWGSTVTNPQPIDSEGIILHIDLRHYEWDVNDAWGQIESAYPYHISFDAPAQTALKAQLARLQTEMKTDIPSVHVDWFLANASLPPLYHDLLDLPSTDRELETQLDVDVNRNLLNAPGVRVWRAGTNNSGVSNNNRVIERHISRYGAYWKSYDFAGSVGTQNIFNHPLSFTHDGGEVIFNLPNGLQAYYVTDASSFRLDEAPISIVSNPAASDPTVRNGLSCFGYHTEGMKTFEDEVRSVIEANTNPAYDKAQALRLYVEQSEMDALLAEDMERYKNALEATGGAVDDIEPISRFHEAYQGPVDAAYAAAVVGLETEVFLEKIRENRGLQNAGLLVLDSPNGSMKRDAWRSNFTAMIYALDFPEEQVESPSQPDVLPGTIVQIPDPNLRAVIAETLGKSPNALITVQEMERLRELHGQNRGIQDLTGLQFAINLRSMLDLRDNQISDMSPIAGLTELRQLEINRNTISDISPVRDLTNLTFLTLKGNQISDISPITGLINLQELYISDNPISDISAVGGLTNLTHLDLRETLVSDLSPVAGLINLELLSFPHKNLSNLQPFLGLVNLKRIDVGWGSPISDLSPFASLTQLEVISINAAKISDLTPLAGLTNLKELHFQANQISDISPLAGLTGLVRLNLADNNISDISPLTGMTNLKWVIITRNQIFDISPLDGLRENIPTFVWHDNPGFPEVGPAIEGPWLWIVIPNTGPSPKDLLSEASGGAVTEVEIATHSVTEGQSLGDDVWTFRRLPPTGWNNVAKMLGGNDAIGIDGATIYGTVSLHSPREQSTTLYVGSHNEFKVWLNGTLIHESLHYHASDGYTDSVPVTLQEGRNVLLVTVRAQYNAFFGFEPGTEYTVANPGVAYAFSKTPIHTGDTFTLNIGAEDVFDMAGWQFDIAFDPAILEALNVTEGDFLKTGGSTTLFQGGSIDNAAGKITGLNAARLSLQGVGGTGTLLQVRFKAKAAGETELALRNFEFAASTGDSIPAGPHEIHITIEGQLTTGDVNRDGRVSILDLVLIAQQLGKRVSAGSAVDVNGDGVVSILDLILVSQRIARSSAAPMARTDSVDAATVEAWIAQARLEDDGSLAFKEGIENLENLLASLVPEETALLANYPNPFNPETWIPYQLAEAAEVTLTIYDINGKMIRRLAVGHKAAGMYRSRIHAVYWDGQNQLGEVVASGLYFYTLTASEFSATRRMLILK